MAERTSIEWTEATWTPIRARNLATGKVGWHCEHASEGCRFCYSETFNERRLGTGLSFKPGHRADVEIFLDEKMLLAPLRWRRPRRIFVCSMTDLFADFVPDAMIGEIFTVMAAAPWHTFQILTKRPGRMRAWISDQRFWAGLASKAMLVGQAPPTWPLPNVWLGTSCEDQATADARVPELLTTPAAVRFVSAEPLLGPIDFQHLRCPNGCMPPEYCNRCYPDGRSASGTFDALADGEIDQIIVGGESGRHARLMQRSWATGIEAQCAAAGVAFFFKQWGEWAPADDFASEQLEDMELRGVPMAGGMVRIGKKAAGRLLDDVEHNEMPEVRA